MEKLAVIAKGTTTVLRDVRPWWSFPEFEDAITACLASVAVTVTELAASLGCVYEDCCDDDSSEDDVPYYAWWVRVPAAEHARRGENGLPVAVDQLHRYLTAHLPYLPHWEIVPDRERTVDHAASSAMRAAYADLVTPFEHALMPLRRDGADALDPRAQVCRWETCGCAMPRAALTPGSSPMDRTPAL
ncbi:hypothetical protein AB0D54_38720 [Streptomyces xanthophaeus]|uniref:hypothetical protein n=1 Tax=Streptomyces xanthophaeus TaxID=67385 RepID=UPI00342170BF